jgi:hypothetical protein
MRSAEGLHELEDAWAELLRLFGDLVVARHHGEPPDPEIGRTGSLARRYRSARRRFDAVLAVASSADLRSKDRRALETIVESLPWLDEWEPTPGVQAELDRAREPEEVAALRRSVMRRYGRAAASIRLGDKTIDRLTAFTRLATEPDPVARRAIFETMAPIWRAVDGDGGPGSPYRRLLRATADRWARDGSTIDANVVALGIDPTGFEPMLRRILGAWRSVVGPGAIEPWDYRFVVGAAARRLDRLVPVERMQPLNDAYLAALGADPTALGIRYDITPRTRRPEIPVAFSIGRGPEPDGDGGWRQRPPWVFATYREGGLGNLGELLHESGHAIHFRAVRSRPAFAEFPTGSSAFLEATADVLGWDVDEPAWQALWLGEAAAPREAILGRYGSVMLDVCWALFEIELHRHPDRRPNDVWTEITSEGLGIVPHPEWSWWAVRGQLIDGPGYLANYALSAIVAAAVRSRLRVLRGDWFAGDPGWYEALSGALFRAGAEIPPAELLQRFLGGPVTEAPLLADLRRTGGAQP